jgi:small subunit ribosomal protein S16
MAVVIRLARFGATHQPKYRITVADSRRWLGGRYIEVVGTYNPSPRGKDQALVLDMAKTEEWIKKGAQPTDRVKKLIEKAKSTPA